MKEAVEMPLDSNQPAWSYHPLLPNPISPTTSRTTGTASRNGARFQSRATDDPKHRSGKQFESSRRSRDDLESQRDTEDQTEEIYHQQESVSLIGIIWSGDIVLSPRVLVLRNFALVVRGYLDDYEAAR